MFLTLSSSGGKEGLDDEAIERELRLRFRETPAWAPTSSPNVTIVDDWPEPLSLPEGLSPVEYV